MDKLLTLLGLLGPVTTTAVAIISLFGVWFQIRWSRRDTSLGPTFLTTLGIFFCFLGIALGLLSFDANDIDNSVPRLLAGIRTSFWASVFGIFWALTIKVRVMYFGDASLPKDGEVEGATVDDLANLLSRLNWTIAANEDSSLLSQIKLLRSDSNDRLDRLNASFQKFAEKVAELNSKALIEALSEVIRDFNAKLNEQFGENFKNLNAAVEKLVVWQQQYERTLNSLIEQETATRKTMTEAALRYADLVTHSTKFVEVSNSLHELMGELNKQRLELTTSLKGLAELINKAATGLPQIEAKIVEMTAQIEKGVRTNNDALGAALKSSAQTLQAHGSQLVSLLEETIASANKSLNAHIRQSTEDSKKQILALDAALEEELRKSIESLGRQLAALSQKFVQDYTPLTDRLRAVLQVGRV